jgi:hypothetical protein
MPIPTSQREFAKGSRRLVDASKALVISPMGVRKLIKARLRMRRMNLARLLALWSADAEKPP